MNKTLLDRYLEGARTDVYEEIYGLGPEAFQPRFFPQVTSVLEETFRRVALNLDIICRELSRRNYAFQPDPVTGLKQPIAGPDPHAQMQLAHYKAAILEAERHFPLSLEYFYKFVGACNFCWDWQTNPDLPWEGADPLYIPPLEDLLELGRDDPYAVSLILSGDYLQKDNISGSCYNIELPDQPSVDSLVLHGNWDIPFIEYLRITFTNCGFSMADTCADKDLNDFCSRVQRELLPI